MKCNTTNGVRSGTVSSAMCRGQGKVDGEKLSEKEHARVFLGTILAKV